MRGAAPGGGTSPLCNAGAVKRNRGPDGELIRVLKVEGRRRLSRLASRESVGPVLPFPSSKPLCEGDRSEIVWSRHRVKDDIFDPGARHGLEKDGGELVEAGTSTALETDQNTGTDSDGMAGKSTSVGDAVTPGALFGNNIDAGESSASAIANRIATSGPC